jgi:hypothetical protein
MENERDIRNQISGGEDGARKSKIERERITQRRRGRREIAEKSQRNRREIAEKSQRRGIPRRRGSG